MKTFHLVYTDKCTVKLASFKTNQERDTFMANFLLSCQDNPDNWVDLVFEGNVSFNAYGKKD